MHVHVRCKLLNKPGTRRRLRKGLQIPMDGLTDWQTDGLADWRTDWLTTDWPNDKRRVQYLSEYVFRCKKGTLKYLGKTCQKSAKPFLKKNPVKSLEPGENSEPNGYCSSIFLHKLKLRIFQDHLKKRCSPIEKGWIEFSITSLEPGGNSEPNGYVQIVS